VEEGLSLREHVVGAEEVGHGAIGMKGVAEGGIGREPVEEREERVWRERMWVVVDEVDEMLGCEGSDELFERRVEWFGFGVENRFRDC
jgi:hypothetical protein